MASKIVKPADDGLLYIVAYSLAWLTGIVVFVMSKPSEKRLRFNGLQSILLGITANVLLFLPIVGWLLAALLWVVGIVAGLKAYNGEDIVLPIIGPYAKKYTS